MAWFDGKEAKVVREAGTINIFYGGSFTSDGYGHGHVKAQGGAFGESIVYWRLPDSVRDAVMDLHKEMVQRFQLFANLGARSIAEYNAQSEESLPSIIYRI